MKHVLTTPKLGIPVDMILAGSVKPASDRSQSRSQSRAQSRLPKVLLRGEAARAWCAGKRTRLYIRESSNKQKDKFGPADQRSAGMRAVSYLKTLMWDHEYVDTASGGGSLSGNEGGLLKRIAFLRAIADAEDGLYDILIIGRADRFARDDADFWSTIMAFIDAGVAVYFEEEEKLCGVEDGWDAIRQEVGAATVWLIKHRKRVQVGFAEKRKVKGTTGGVPLGYEMDGKKDRIQPKHLAECKNAAKVATKWDAESGRPVEWALDCAPRKRMGPGKNEEWPALCPVQLPRQTHLLYHTGQFTIRTLAERLSAFGFISRQALPIGPSTVASILGNPIVIGTRRLDVSNFEGRQVFGEEHTDWVPGIVGADVFADNQARAETGATYKRPNRPDRQVLPFVEVLRCGRLKQDGETCGEPLNLSMSTPDQARPGQRLYRYGHPRHKGCHEVGMPEIVISELPLLAFVREMAYDLLLTPAQMTKLDAYHRQMARTQTGALQTRADLEAKLQRLHEIYEQGGSDKVTYQAKVKAVKDELAKQPSLVLVPEEENVLFIRSLARSWDAFAGVPQTAPAEEMFKARAGLKRIVSEFFREMYVSHTENKGELSIKVVFKDHYLNLVKAAYVGDLSKLLGLIGQDSQREEVLAWATFQRNSDQAMGLVAVSGRGRTPLARAA